MTEPTQADAAEILKQLYEAIQQARQEITELKTENANLKKAISDDIPQAVSKQITDVANAVAEGFKNRDEIINQLRQVAVPQQKSGGGMADAVGRIADMIEKSLSGSGNSGGGFTQEMQGYFENIMKEDFKQMLYSARKRSQILNATTADHITVEP